MKVKKFFITQLGHLFFGFILWFPVIIIVAVLIWIFGAVEGVGDKLLSAFLPKEFIYPGFGIILALLFLYISGVIFKSAVVRKFLSRIPFIGLFLGHRDGKTISFSKLIQLKPCIFLYSPTCISYGWILSEELVTFTNKKEASLWLINVYYPNVPTLITGQIFLARKETVIRLGNNSKEIIDLLLYALKSPKSIIYLPWEGETEEEFKKRAEKFGIT